MKFFCFVIYLTSISCSSFIKNEDFYNAIESRYKDTIKLNGKFVKHKAAIYNFIEQFVRKNIDNITECKDSNLNFCGKCNFFHHQPIPLLLHHCVEKNSIDNK